MTKKRKKKIFLEQETKALDDFISERKEQCIVALTHDSPDPDVLGSVAILQKILEPYGKELCCLYSRQPTYPITKEIEGKLLTPRLMRRLEDEDLSKILDSCSGMLLIDAPSPETISCFDQIANLEVWKTKKKPLLCFDHHIQSTFPPFVTPYKVECGATATIFTIIANNLEIKISDDQNALMAAYLGIETDTQQFNKSLMTELDCAALDLIVKNLAEESKQKIEEIKELRYPKRWYAELGNAFALVPKFDPDIAIYGIGVTEDKGVVSFITEKLMATGHFNTVVCAALFYERVGDGKSYVDFVASGRSKDEKNVNLPSVFSKVFSVSNGIDRTLLGGGRKDPNGQYSVAGASIPLYDEIKKYDSPAEDFVKKLKESIWPLEAERFLRRIGQELGISDEDFGKKVFIRKYSGNQD